MQRNMISTLQDKAKWTDLCRYWTSKVGDSLITYFDMDKQEYRTAKKSWTIRTTETRY